MGERGSQATRERDESRKEQKETDGADSVKFLLLNCPSAIWITG